MCKIFSTFEENPRNGMSDYFIFSGWQKEKCKKFKKKPCKGVSSQGIKSSCKPRHIFKALLHCAIFRATCVATPLQDKLHESLPSVTYLGNGQKRFETN